MAEKQSNTSTPRGKRSSSPEEEIFARLMAETEAYLPESELDEIEQALRRSWERRAAMAFLCQRFKDMCGKVEAERETAVAFADLYLALDGSIKMHEHIVKLMKAAHARLLVLMAVREDMDGVLKEAGRGDQPQTRH